MEFPAKDKYWSMQRAYARLKKINTNNGSEISNADARDTIEDFFNQAYHFKDWLKKDPDIVLTNDVEEYINGNFPLSLAADYCNSFKHAGLDREPRAGKSIEKINTHINFVFEPTKGFSTSSSLELTINEQKYDAFKLATECIEAWNTFLGLNHIVIPNP